MTLPNPYQRPDDMKILYVHAKGEIGGSDISLLTILKNINKKIFSPNVIVAKKGPLFNDYKKYSAKCEEVKFSVLKSPDNIVEFLKIMLLFIPSVFWIWGIIKKWKIDLVHVNTIVVPSAMIAAKLAGKPVIVHKREIIVSNKIASNILDWLTFLFADKVIAISSEVKNSSLHVLQKKTIVIYNGVDTSEISVERQNKLRRKYKVPQSALLVGIFSRIEPWKGQHIVIKSLSTVLSKFGNVRLMVFGAPYTKKGEYYLDELKNIVQKMNLQSVVSFPGLVKNLNDIYSDFDLIIVPSVDPEPLGRVIIESMAAGVPVIATNLGGTKECLINDKTGLLVKANDIDAMEAALIKVLSNKNLREKMGTNGRERAEKLFDIKIIIKRVESVYRKFNHLSYE